MSNQTRTVKALSSLEFHLGHLHPREELTAEEYNRHREGALTVAEQELGANRGYLEGLGKTELYFYLLGYTSGVERELY